MPMTRFSQKGFSIIELLVVVALISIIGSVTIAMVSSYRERAQYAKARSEITTLYQALLRYNVDTGTYPSCGVGSGNLEDISANPPTGWNSSWKNGYISVSIDNDPWGTSYYYDGCPLPGYECAPGASSVCSAGPDRAYESFNEADMTANDDDVCIYFQPQC